MRKALITGITGQDGSYLAEFLLYKGYEVHGIIRRSSSFHTRRIDHIYDKIHLHYGDITDYGNTSGLIQTIKPDEVYNLAAQSHVRVSFDMPEYTTSTITLGNLNLLESIKRTSKQIKFYQASSSEMFGSSPPPQNEETKFHPRSPYGVAKLAAYWNTKNYREGYDLLTYNGILFNHTSPRRGHTFVTRKITSFIAQLLAKKANILSLGNLYSSRDFGFAPEFVKTIWLMMQGKPTDLVIGTGTTYSIKYFLKKAFEYVGFPVIFRGEGIREVGVFLSKKESIINISPRFYRPTEVDSLKADVKKAKETINWEPKIKINEIIKIMIDYDMEKEGLSPIGEGKKILRRYGYDWSIIG